MTCGSVKPEVRLLRNVHTLYVHTILQDSGRGKRKCYLSLIYIMNCKSFPVLDSNKRNINILILSKDVLYIKAIIGTINLYKVYYEVFLMLYSNCRLTWIQTAHRSKLLNYQPWSRFHTLTRLFGITFFRWSQCEVLWLVYHWTLWNSPHSWAPSTTRLHAAACLVTVVWNVLGSICSSVGVHGDK